MASSGFLFETPTPLEMLSVCSCWKCLPGPSVRSAPWIHCLSHTFPNKPEPVENQWCFFFKKTRNHFMVISSRRLVLRCFPWLHQAKKRKLAPSSSPLSTSKVAVYGPLATGMVSRSARPITRDGMHWQGRSYAGAGAVFSMVFKGIKIFCTKFSASNEFQLDTNEFWGELIFGWSKYKTRW